MIVRLILALLALWLNCCSGMGGPVGDHTARPMTLQLQRRSRGDSRSMRRERALSAANPPELAPVFPGYGTHYAFVYVGTPPQRQSVIIDTGSHYTAFPCAGCSNCKAPFTTLYTTLSYLSRHLSCRRKTHGFLL